VFVAACAVAACGDAGAVDPASTTLDVVAPASPPGTAFAERMRYSIECAGTDGESFDDEIVEGPFERTADHPYDGAEVWRTDAVLPPGPCVIQVRAFGPDNEILCTMNEGFSVAADAQKKVNLVLICDLGIQVPN